MGIIDNMVVFNDTSTKDFHILVSGYGSFNTPERDITLLDVKGRDGSLAIDNGRFNNVDLTYKCLIYRDMKPDYDAFRAFIATQRGYKRLEDTFHVDEFRMAMIKDAIEANPKGDYEAISFELVFNCKPQRFLKSGEDIIEVVNSGIIENPTLFDAKPLIRMYGNGTIIINGRTMTVTNVNGYIDIDSDLMNAYKGSTNMNNNISGEFPILNAGENEITCSNRIEIKPRWFNI